MCEIKVARLGIILSILKDFILVAFVIYLPFVTIDGELWIAILMYLAFVFYAFYFLINDVLRYLLYRKIGLVSYENPVTLIGNKLKMNVYHSSESQYSIFIRNSKFGYGEKVKGEYMLSKFEESIYKAEVSGDLAPSDKGYLAKNQWYLCFYKKVFIFKSEIKFQLKVENA